MSDIAKRFKSETVGHEMTVLHDDGLYRHLRFSNPKSELYWYEVVTTPGQLVFSGDGESFVFRAIPDMFKMFRRTSESGGINATYWSEKCKSGNEFSYSRELFEAHVWKAVAAAEPQYRELRENVQKEIFNSESFNVDYEADALFAALNFVHHLTARPKSGELHPAPFTFRRIHDWDLRDFDWWYLFACHAIKDAIAQYDAARQAVAA
ncbi:hypothetical protein [Streptomyces sp. NBC_01716]|uniref:hypothetical protein n=1 Tax=Streptomyces sp. NBC_01716 TaxID=2975917 RepID=UPI002E320FCB|nr:hypothetical protein [Streptomyces sp. NBC_01716]